MKYINFFSWLTIIVTIVAAIFSVSNFYSLNKASPISNITVGYDTLTQALQNIKELSIQGPGDTISIKEYNFKITELQQQLSGLKNQSTQQFELESEKDFTTQTFWIKVIFSGIFCIAALFVILSKRYDDETKKWAFSVLTLIAGVWIGTIS